MASFRSPRQFGAHLHLERGECGVVGTLGPSGWGSRTFARGKGRVTVWVHFVEKGAGGRGEGRRERERDESVLVGYERERGKARYERESEGAGYERERGREASTYSRERESSKTVYERDVERNVYERERGGEVRVRDGRRDERDSRAIEFERHRPAHMALDVRPRRKREFEESGYDGRGERHVEARRVRDDRGFVRGQEAQEDSPFRIRKRALKAIPYETERGQGGFPATKAEEGRSRHRTGTPRNEPTQSYAPAEAVYRPRDHYVSPTQLRLSKMLTS